MDRSAENDLYTLQHTGSQFGPSASDRTESCLPDIYEEFQIALDVTVKNQPASNTRNLVIHHSDHHNVPDHGVQETTLKDRVPVDRASLSTLQHWQSQDRSKEAWNNVAAMPMFSTTATNTNGQQAEKTADMTNKATDGSAQDSRHA